MCECVCVCVCVCVVIGFGVCVCMFLLFVFFFFLGRQKQVLVLEYSFHSRSSLLFVLFFVAKIDFSRKTSLAIVNIVTAGLPHVAQKAWRQK